jgi:cyanate permease
MVGVGGLLGPWLVGIIREATGKFPWAIQLLAACFLVQAIFIVAMRVKRKLPSEPEALWAKDEPQSAD